MINELLMEDLIKFSRFIEIVLSLYIGRIILTLMMMINISHTLLNISIYIIGNWHILSLASLYSCNLIELPPGKIVMSRLFVLLYNEWDFFSVEDYIFILDTKKDDF